MSDLIYGLKTSFPDYKVYVGAPQQEPYFSIYQQQAIDCFPLPFRRFSVPCFVRLVQFIRKNQITLIHSHGRGAGIYSRLIKFLMPDRVVVHTFHGCFHETNLLGWMKVKLDQWLEPMADFYLSVSNDEYAQLIKWKFAQKNRCLTIPNGIKLNAEPQVLKRTPPQTVGTLARLSEQKGWDLLFEQYLNFLRQKATPTFKIRIGGFPKGQLKIPAELAGRLTEIGEVESSRCFFAEIDIYVSSSRVEGLPLIVLEAMGSGVPCLLSEVTGHQYFIENGVALGFTLGDAQSFSEQLGRLLSDSELYQQLVSKGREFVLKHHSLQNQVEETVKIYQQVSAHLATV